MKPSGSRVKGSVGEREVVRLFQEAGFPARRVPLSGAMKDTGFGGDVDVVLQSIAGVADPSYGWTSENKKTIEVKRRATGFKRIYQWLGDHFALVFRSDRNEYLITMKLSDFLGLMK